MKQSVIEKKAPFSQKLVYAFGEFPGAAVTSIINLLLLIYLTDFIRISPFWAGAIMFVGFIWDGLTDPYVGYLSDNSHSRLGRRKSFMIKYMVPFAVFFIALFSVPTLFRENSEIVKVLIVLLVYMIYILVYTLVCIPYNTVISDMTDDYDERTSFTTWRMTVSIMATLLSIVIPEILGLSTLNQGSGLSLLVLGVVFGILIVIFGLIAGFGIKERQVVNREKVPFSFQKYFFHSFGSHYFRKVCIMYFCSFACLAAINVSLLYFLNYYLLLPSLLVPIGGGVMVLAIIVLPLWNYLCRKIGKKEF